MKPERVIHLLQIEKEYALKQTGHSQQPINKEVRQALDIAINAVGAIEQLRWERDTAVKQREAAAADFANRKKNLVEVVRCKDCKHYMEDAGMSPDFIAYYCSLNNDDYSFDRNDFCSFGERGSDNG